MATPRFLMLQGLRSPFFKVLGQGLKSCGVPVDKLNYTVGDELYWDGHYTPCRASLATLHSFYERLLTAKTYTDMVLFGDCRPVHRPAIDCARQQGVRVHVFEEGYFRPDWVTLERGGVNGYSALPKSAAWYRKVAKHLAAHETDSAPSFEEVPRTRLRTTALSPTSQSGSSLPARVAHDILYNVASIANRWRYPDYPSHVSYRIRAEYVAYLKRAWRIYRRRAQDQAVVQSVCQPSGMPFYLLALQIRGDSQLQFHSDYANPQRLLQEVLGSFAAHAPAETRLIIKNHPLDHGLTDYEAIIHAMTQQFGIGERVAFIETGHLPTLLRHARGMVTVNSTTIGQALFHGCAVKALGQSIFDLRGLTYQEALDTFWTNAGPVDQALFQALQRVVIYATQLRGGLYRQRDIALTMQEALPRLLEPEDRLQALLREHPIDSSHAGGRPQ